VPTAGTEGAGSAAAAPGANVKVEPTRIPYRPDYEGIVRGGKLHPLVANTNCEYYKKPFKKKSAMEIGVGRGQDDDDSDDCRMTLREIRKGVAGAFREAESLGKELVSYHPNVDCTRIGGNRTEYFLCT
jgi:hypothetical protein